MTNMISRKKRKNNEDVVPDVWQHVAGLKQANVYPGQIGNYYNNGRVTIASMEQPSPS